MSNDRREPSDIFEADAPAVAPAEEADTSDSDGTALIKVAERKRRRGRGAAAEGDTPEADAIPPSTRRRRRKAAAHDATEATEAGDVATPPADPAAAVPRGPRAWTAACVCAALAVAVLSVAAVTNLPRSLPIEDRPLVSWLDGPQANQREIDGWLASFPYRDQLADANGWVMGKLAEHLLAQPGVGEVQRIDLVYEQVGSGDKPRLGRKLRIRMGMRRPYMPGVLASGQRVWIDAEGVILPGSLEGPDKRRPLVRGLEDSPGSLRTAVAAWRRIEPYIDQNLVTSIHCSDMLNDAGDRGIVMSTRTGTRLVWGRPDEERFGRDTEAKARDLIHTIRCQGDLGRVAAVNVRFAKPFYTPR